MVVAKLEANKEDIQYLAKEYVKNNNDTSDNLFDFEELAANLPLSERLANRIKQILRKTRGIKNKFIKLFNYRNFTGRIK